jgi:hypothetical protein
MTCGLLPIVCITSVTGLPRRGVRAAMTRDSFWQRRQPGKRRRTMARSW